MKRMILLGLFYCVISNAVSGKHDQEKILTSHAMKRLNTSRLGVKIVTHAQNTGVSRSNTPPNSGEMERYLEMVLQASDDSQLNFTQPALHQVPHLKKDEARYCDCACVIQ
ncbi:MAG: hypothetical protein P4L31_01435 [Candidatus Babeliales bacterium]|nr:hypothetical protein [Candidatus Babeliales bacterium]